MQFRKLTLAALLGFVLLSGCFTPAKMDGWIEQHEGGFSKKLKTSDYITIKTPALSEKEQASTSQKGRGKFVPAIIYWKSERTIVSTLNTYIPVGLMNSTIIQYANTKSLKQKLNGQKVELTINKFPSVFTFTDRYQLFFFLVFYVQSEHLFIRPQKEDISVSYKILKDSIETKSGTIIIPDADKTVNQKIFQSAKKLTWDYLDEYDTNIRTVSRQIVDKLLSAL
jgi:hypothetical protein